MHKITPFLWFDTQAEEAMQFYCSVFPNSKVGTVSKLPDGKITAVTFELDGQPFIAMNAGPQFHFNEAISLFVNCQDQSEVDELWEKLSQGGKEGQCGWVQDKFGLWWQIIPEQLSKLMGDSDLAKAGRVMQSMLSMRKIIIADLQAAYDGK